MNNLSKIQIVLHALSALAMATFVYLYVSHNAPGLTDVPIVAILGVVYVAMFMLANPGLIGGRESCGWPITSVVFPVTCRKGLAHIQPM